MQNVTRPHNLSRHRRLSALCRSSCIYVLYSLTALRASLTPSQPVTSPQELQYYNRPVRTTFLADSQPCGNMSAIPSIACIGIIGKNVSVRWQIDVFLFINMQSHRIILSIYRYSPHTLQGHPLLPPSKLQFGHHFNSLFYWPVRWISLNLVRSLTRRLAGI